MSRETGNRKYIAESIRTMPTSGIRKFFDVANTMEGVVSLGVGEPDFNTPWHASEAAILSIERGQTSYTSNQGMMSSGKQSANTWRKNSTRRTGRRRLS